jgi:hypothetical protein
MLEAKKGSGLEVNTYNKGYNGVINPKVTALIIQQMTTVYETLM